MNPGQLKKVMGRQMPFSERLAAGCIAGTWADVRFSINRVQGATNWATSLVAHGWGGASDIPASVDAQVGYLPIHGENCRDNNVWIYCNN